MVSRIVRCLTGRSRGPSLNHWSRSGISLNAEDSRPIDRVDIGNSTVTADSTPITASGDGRVGNIAVHEAGFLTNEARAFERAIAAAPDQWWAIFFPIWPDLEAEASA